MKLADIPKTTKTFWKALGEKICNMIRARVQKDHKNAGSQGFNDYSEKYAERKEQNKARAKGASQQSTSTNPDMTLTGKTMSNLQVHTVTDKNVIIGWIEIFAQRVQHLHDMKKRNYKIVNIGSGDPFAKKEMDFIDKQINSDIDKKIKAYCKTPIIIKVGT